MPYICFPFADNAISEISVEPMFQIVFPALHWLMTLGTFRNITRLGTFALDLLFDYFEMACDPDFLQSWVDFTGRDPPLIEAEAFGQGCLR